MNFATWLRTALPGSSVAYHTGLLMYDRQREVNPRGYEAVDSLGKAAWRAHEAGRVALTQRRLGSGRSQYIATRL